MLHSAQVRAARGLLGWAQGELARQAKVSIITVQRIEKAGGPVMSHTSTLVKIQEAFERAGIRFIDEDESGGIGVRLVKPRPKRARKG